VRTAFASTSMRSSSIIVPPPAYMQHSAYELSCPTCMTLTGCPNNSAQLALAAALLMSSSSRFREYSCSTMAAAFAMSSRIASMVATRSNASSMHATTNLTLPAPCRSASHKTARSWPSSSCSLQGYLEFPRDRRLGQIADDLGLRRLPQPSPAGQVVQIDQALIALGDLLDGLARVPSESRTNVAAVRKAIRDSEESFNGTAGSGGSAGNQSASPSSASANRSNSRSPPVTQETCRPNEPSPHRCGISRYSLAPFRPLRGPPSAGVPKLARVSSNDPVTRPPVHRAPGHTANRATGSSRQPFQACRHLTKNSRGDALCVLDAIPAPLATLTVANQRASLRSGKVGSAPRLVPDGRPEDGRRLRIALVRQ